MVAATSETDSSSMGTTRQGAELQYLFSLYTNLDKSFIIVQDAKDTSHFDKYPEQESVMRYVPKPGDNWDDDF